ncbi:TLP18.3/Psb32/MOLO-1 phosphatase superfamily protein [Paucimonas lemoignei]|uniref:TLP18.3/Psb32/MOLO-1 phosphatase superfamily protein n=1 Tax=Paucimonas lemoignei TaxID=29443 RepID=A0A4R3HTB4_PAULE|nr:TPM domain-containing protein [Paucimonas lemoignei]TCS36218.1 TLP18.3/Psb32/MOLO-1 phosphatase superfamily protein [Paucimonas lemoignei]
MNKLSRFFRHVLTTRVTAQKAFPPQALHDIQAAIASGEKLHRAEIRLIIEPALPITDMLQGAHSRARARELFTLYRVWDTEDNCGVLVYINLADHKVEIIADRASGRALQPNDWKEICRRMTEGFSHGEYGPSVLAALDLLNRLLQQHFPGQGDNLNELSDRPLIV